ncbi:MAG: hypothetical protein IJD04_00115 [Desulfovibrionaceae bacterium]|nr:hypothetical protein [Desulfovibrionaceae bacterium]
MENMGVIIGILCYFAGMILVGFLLRNKNKGAEDFLVGGRQFGLFFNAGTLTACFLGGGLLISSPGLLLGCGIWNDDIKFGWLMTFGAIPCLVGAGLFFMRKMWRLKLLSLGDFYYRRFGRNTGIVSTVLMAFTFTFWVATQTLAFAKVGVSLIGWELNYWIVVSMIVICLYTLLGGLWAVCITDIIQVIIVLAGIIIMTPVAVSMVGGWDVFVEHVPQDKLQVFPHRVDAILPWFATLAIVGLGSIINPDLMQRAFSAKSPKVAEHSAYWAAGISTAVKVFVFILTFAALQIAAMAATDPSIGLNMDMIMADPEMTIPLAFSKVMPGPIVVLFLGALMAAVMSAAATANIALAGVLAKNLVQDIFFPNMSSRALMQVSRLIVLIIGVIGMAIAIGLPSAALVGALGFDLILSCTTMPGILGLYWKKTNGYGAVAGMLSGAFVRVVVCGMVNGFSLAGISAAGDTWYYFTIFGPITSLIFTVVVSLATQKIDPPVVLEMDPDPDRPEAA